MSISDTLDEVLGPNTDSDLERDYQIGLINEFLQYQPLWRIKDLYALMFSAAGLDEVELEVLRSISRRLLLGATDYGKMPLQSNKDLLKEATEEMLDGAVYLAWRLLQERARLGRDT